MNLENVIIDYRKEILKSNTPTAKELKKDLDLYSRKLITLFDNMGIDHLALKEDRRKNGQWRFEDNKKKTLFVLLEQLSNKQSAASMVSVGKEEEVSLICLVELVDLCMDLLDGTGISKGQLEKEREKAYKRLEIPLMELRQEIHGLEHVIETSFDNEDDVLPMELHMKFQEYFSKKIRALKLEAALVYYSMNEEVSSRKFMGAVSSLKKTDGWDEYQNNSKKIRAILAEEFPNLNITDKVQTEEYEKRRKELMSKYPSKIEEFRKYAVQQAKIDGLCEENEEYCKQVEKINSIMKKKTKGETKVFNYCKEMDKLHQIKDEISKNEFGENLLERPDICCEEEMGQDAFDVDEILNRNFGIIRGIIYYDSEEEIKNRALYQLAEQIFGKLL